MQTFKNFWKILFHYKWGLLIQIGVMVGFAAFLLFSHPQDDINEWKPLAAQIGVVDHDDSAISRLLIQYLKRSHTVAVVEDGKETVFLTNMNYILIIPEGFSAGFEEGNTENSLEYIISSKGRIPAYINAQISHFFRILNVYLAGGLDLPKALDLAVSDLTVEMDVELISSSETGFPLYLYFRFLPVFLLTFITIALGGIFMVLGREGLLRRIECGAVTLKRRNWERVFSCLSVAFIAWAILVAVPYAFFFRQMLGLYSFLKLLNTVPLIFLGLAVAFMLSQFVKSKEALYQSLVAIIAILIMPSGIFLEQWNLDERILAIGRFTPLYWYTRTNDMFILGTTINMEVFWQGIMIQLAFAAAILAVALVISKEKREIL